MSIILKSTEIINITASVPSFNTTLTPLHFKDSTGFVAARDQVFPIYLNFDTSIKVIPDSISFLSVYTAGYEAIKNFELQASETGLFTGEEVTLLTATHPDATSTEVSYNITNNTTKYNHFRLKFIDYHAGNGGGEIIIKNFKMYRSNNIVGDSIIIPEIGWKRSDDSELNTSNFTNGGFITNSNMYNGSFLFINGTGTISFKFKGTKLRLISEWYRNRSSNIQITIDNLPTENFSQYIASGNPLHVIGYEKEELEDIIHEVTIYSDNDYSLDAIDIDDTGYLDNFNITYNIIQNINSPLLLDIAFSKNITLLNILVNDESKLLLSGIDINSYKYNLDKIWNELPYDNIYNIIISTDKGDSKVISINKPYLDIVLFNNIYPNKDITVDYIINPSYNNLNNPIDYTYTITLDEEVLFSKYDSTNQQIASSIIVPYDKLVKGDYKNVTNRNLVVNKSNSNGEVISYNIPVKVNPKRLFSKYFNGVDNYIIIKNWVKPLNQLVIQVVKKSSTDSDFTVSTNNSLISLSETELKIGGVSTFTGNIYEIRVWELGKEQAYSYNQLYGNEDGLYALYRMNEYNSKNIYDICKNKLHGVYTGELINQDIKPNDSNYLTKPIINANNDIVLQKQDYNYKYDISNKTVSYRNIDISSNEIILPLNNILILQNLSIQRYYWYYDANSKVGDILLQPEFGWKRIDINMNDSNFKYSGTWKTGSASSCWNNTRFDTTESGAYVEFNAKFRAFRLMCTCWSTYSNDVKCYIDGVEYNIQNRLKSNNQVLTLEVFGLANEVHNVKLMKKDATSTSLIFSPDSMDIDENGYMIPIT